MSKDYYQELEINRDASQQDIAKAYRKLSLRWHPKLCSLDPKTQRYHFCQISEAFEVLNDPVKRAFYDKYGEEKLKQGLFAQGELKGGYRFKDNPDEIFNQFYGQNNAFAQIFDDKGTEELGSMFGNQFGGQSYEGIEPPKDLNVAVEVTLEELYNGCSKEVQFNKKQLNNDARTTSDQLQNQQIHIVPGTKTGAKIVLENQGNEAPNVKPSNLIFSIVEIPHSQFRRKNNDLIYVQKINLVEALSCPVLNIRTLDGRQIFVSMDQLISPSTVKQVKGEGMPINDEVNQLDNLKQQKSIKKGDLHIKFDIEFPKEISEDKKLRLKELLQ